MYWVSRGFSGRVLPNSRRFKELFLHFRRTSGLFWRWSLPCVRVWTSFITDQRKKSVCQSLRYFRFLSLLWFAGNHLGQFLYFICVCLYLYCFTCLLVVVLFKNSYWRCHFRRNQKIFFEIDFFLKNKFYMWIIF